jgi:hypothetical protein
MWPDLTGNNSDALHQVFVFVPPLRLALVSQAHALDKRTSESGCPHADNP